MDYFTQNNTDENSRFFQKVYEWMFLGLLVSGITAYWISNDPTLYEYIIFSKIVFYLLLFGEIALGLSLVWLMKRISSQTAIIMFLVYCFMTGLTLSVIFLAFTIESICKTFFISAGMFGVMGIYGYYTKKDLSNIGQVLKMGLLGLVIAGIVNLFLQSSGLDYILSFIGIIVFTGLTAYDTQKIRNNNIIGNENTPEDEKEAIMGALTLYLDYMNLFLDLLKILGKRR